MRRHDYNPMLTPSRLTFFAATVATVALAAAGCTDKRRVDFATQQPGEKCSLNSDCVAGFTCTRNETGGRVCTMVEGFPDTGVGDACSSDSDCQTGLFCSNQDRCSSFRGQDEGATCGLPTDCRRGLICRGTGICGTDDGRLGTLKAGESCENFCDDYETEPGEICDALKACELPLICPPIPGGTCSKIPFFQGPVCLRSFDERGRFRVYFELPDFENIPRPNTPEADSFEFYRLPFPNDARKDATGRLSLEGHPGPGVLFGFDPFGDYTNAIEEDAGGFGPNQPVFFRFSAPLRVDDMGEPTTVNADPSDPNANVILVNIDPDSPEVGTRHAVQWAYGKERTQYICQNWLGFKVVDGAPLLPGTMYAGIVRNTLVGVGDRNPEPDDDLKALLAAELPEDADERVQRAYPTYAPLRAALPQLNITVEEVAGATLFTTGDPVGIAARMRAAVRADSRPTLKGEPVNCEADGAVAPNPCAFLDDPNRGCQEGNADNYVELQGVYTQATWQKGERPYRLPTAEGAGALDLDADGNPQPTGTEDMCYGLAVPRGATMPENGWPVVIFAHGTGGSYRSAFRGSVTGEGVAGMLTNVPGPGGNTAARFAVLSFDNVGHGPRQNLEPPSEPDQIFFNVFNARAARDNVVQGAADLFSLVKLAENFNVNVNNFGNVKLDPNNIFFMGHSQGTVIAPPFLAAETNVKSTVLAGAGAELSLSFLFKRRPVDIASVAKLAFGDQALSAIHPMLGLVAQLFGSADAVHMAPLWANRTGGRAANNVLMVYGVGDGFTPDQTQTALVRAMGAPLVEPIRIDPVPEGLTTVSPPVSGNLNGATVGVVQYPKARPGDPSDDGHFVIFNRTDALTQAAQYLASGLNGATPVIRAVEE